MWLEDLIHLLGNEKVIVNESMRRKLSKDYYWYSPILFDELDDMIADCAVTLSTVEEIRQVVSFAVKNKIPITVRGGGTGNYGQAVPLQGGIVLDITKLNQILEIGKDSIHVQAGVRLGALEKALRKVGKELRIYPSTYVTSTVGGFLCGGSGGIGSIRWGNLWDDNILQITIMTMEEQPQLITVTGEKIQQYIHNYGTTGILLGAVLPIEVMTEWSQHGIFFDTFKIAVKFCDELAYDESIKKRLVSTCEWPIPTHFHPLKDIVQKGKAMVMLEVDELSRERLDHMILKYDGVEGFYKPASEYQKGLKISDFTWNHATLWAHKNGDHITYLQARFKTDRIFEQMEAIREKFGYEVQFHLEYIKVKGEVTPSSLPIIEYTTKERIYEIIDFFKSMEVEVNNPHTYLLGFGGYNLQMEKILQKKQENDPFNLLNPGKLPTRDKARELLS